MELDQTIQPPAGGASNEDASENVFHVFEDFVVIYQPALVSVEQYLKEAIEKMDPNYAKAYIPWHTALHDLFAGSYLIARHMPLPEPENFLAALRLFSFDSAIQFLQDLCISCKIKLERDWPEHFRQHIDALLVSSAELYPQL